MVAAAGCMEEDLPVREAVLEESGSLLRRISVLILSLLRVDREELLHELGDHECLRVATHQSGQDQHEEVIEAADVAKQHENVIDDALLLDDLVREPDVEYPNMIMLFSPHYRVEVQIVDNFWLSEVHEIERVVIELGPVLVERQMVDNGLDRIDFPFKSGE
eukprot:CAMPEP_0185575644 /NCGR_PEP_ID=MMETSP0434-20130131/6782_1 /TAXON_ID=626734 ORGANISM="Favella taraikaensis, Strain Fe Narragansett Bay" /NCGR_SAMPLE_ID=MMETSP0434 /ASSEMBLY_ACC=CAM_ASM_000379 /LENGTH=161 /DNA_ID=CAMNT_0028192583 /DNA_START=486 /DNA_END=971 /DNA_ORIENTATION=-